MERMPTALVIDDAPDQRLVARRMLERLGFTAAEAGDGAETVAWLRGNPSVELILLDWHMRPVGGYALLRALRANPALSATRVILVTAERGAAHHRLAIDHGCDATLLKPLSLAALRGELERLGVPVGQ